MFTGLRRGLSHFAGWMAGVVRQLGGALNGGRNSDSSATKLYEQPRDEYRP
jgi:hypothetical protein